MAGDWIEGNGGWSLSSSQSVGSETGGSSWFHHPKWHCFVRFDEDGWRWTIWCQHWGYRTQRSDGTAESREAAMGAAVASKNHLVEDPTHGR